MVVLPGTNPKHAFADEHSADDKGVGLFEQT